MNVRIPGFRDVPDARVCTRLAILTGNRLAARTTRVSSGDHCEWPSTSDTLAIAATHSLASAAVSGLDKRETEMRRLPLRPAHS